MGQREYKSFCVVAHYTTEASRANHSQIDLVETQVQTDFDVVVVGSVNLDVVFRTHRFPQVGETLTGAAVLDSLGGKGSNQAVAAARQGARVAMIACVGDDA